MFDGLPGGLHPTMADCACEGLGELGCSVLSALLSSTGQYFACLSICVLITDSSQYVRGCLATGRLPPAGVFFFLITGET